MSTLDPVLDGPRMTLQREKVLAVMEAGEWLGLLEIAQRAGLSAAQLPGISARLRDFRKWGHTVDRRRVHCPRNDRENQSSEKLLSIVREYLHGNASFACCLRINKNR